MGTFTIISLILAKKNKVFGILTPIPVKKKTIFGPTKFFCIFKSGGERFDVAISKLRWCERFVRHKRSQSWLGRIHQAILVIITRFSFNSKYKGNIFVYNSDEFNLSIHITNMLYVHISLPSKTANWFVLTILCILYYYYYFLYIFTNRMCDCIPVKSYITLQ